MKFRLHLLAFLVLVAQPSCGSDSPAEGATGGGAGEGAVAGSAGVAGAATAGGAAGVGGSGGRAGAATSGGAFDEGPHAAHRIVIEQSAMAASWRVDMH